MRYQEREERERERENESSNERLSRINKSYDFSGPHIGRSWNRKFDNEFGDVTMDKENSLHLKLDSFSRRFN